VFSTELIESWFFFAHQNGWFFEPNKSTFHQGKLSAEGRGKNDPFLCFFLPSDKVLSNFLLLKTTFCVKTRFFSPQTPENCGVLGFYEEFMREVIFWVKK